MFLYFFPKDDTSIIRVTSLILSSTDGFEFLSSVCVKEKEMSIQTTYVYCNITCEPNVNIGFIFDLEISDFVEMHIYEIQIYGDLVPDSLFIHSNNISKITFSNSQPYITYNRAKNVIDGYHSSYQENDKQYFCTLITKVDEYLWLSIELTNEYLINYVLISSGKHAKKKS